MFRNYQLFRYSACEGPAYGRSTYFKRRSKGLGSAPYAGVRDTRVPHVLNEVTSLRFRDQFEPNFL